LANCYLAARPRRKLESEVVNLGEAEKPERGNGRGQEVLREKQAEAALLADADQAEAHLMDGRCGGK